MTTKEITDLRKSGEIEKAYEESKILLDSNPDDRYARIGAAYCIKELMEHAARSGDYKHLARLLDEFAALRLEEIGETELNNKCSWAVRSLILTCKENPEFLTAGARTVFEAVQAVAFLKPHRYYSVLLDAFLKLKEPDGTPWADTPEVISWWGLENLLPEDYERVLLTNGQRMPSLAERAYTACFRCLMSGLNQGEMRDEAESFLGDLEVLEEAHPDFQYVPYQKTQILKALGHKEAALAAAVETVRRRRNDFWTWTLLGDLMDDSHSKMVCYSRALLCRTQPAFLMKVRRKLAALMLEAGLYANARLEYDKVAALYNSRGLKMKPELADVYTQQWYETTQPAPGNRDFYIQLARESNSLLLADVPETAILISKYNPEKQTCSYVTADHKRGYFSTKKLKFRFATNQILLVRFEGEAGGDKPGNVLSCRVAEDVTPYEGKLYRIVETELNLRPGMSFLFVDDIYIDGTLLQGHSAGEKVKVTGVLYYNLKKETWGWRAVRIVPA